MNRVEGLPVIRHEERPDPLLASGPAVPSAAEGQTEMTMMRRGGLLLLVLGPISVFVYAWYFAASNANPVEIHYLFGELPPLELWKALAAASFAGALMVMFLMSYGWIRARLESRRYREALLDLEAEVHQLRNLPLNADDPIGSASEGLARSGMGAGRSG
jgi:uncharacterized integral membrane protein